MQMQLGKVISSKGGLNANIHMPKCSIDAKTITFDTKSKPELEFLAFNHIFGKLQQHRISESPVPPRLWDSLETSLCSKAGSNEGGSAGGASPTAHDGPDCFIQSIQSQDTMKRSLERTRQSSCV